MPPELGPASGDWTASPGTERPPPVYGAASPGTEEPLPTGPGRQTAATGFLMGGEGYSQNIHSTCDDVVKREIHAKYMVLRFTLSSYPFFALFHSNSQIFFCFINIQVFMIIKGT